MPKALRTLIICALLIVGAASPAVAADLSHPAAPTALGVHSDGAADDHSP